MSTELRSLGSEIREAMPSGFSSVGNAERSFVEIEKSLNRYGYIPGVSVFSGAFRSLIGSVQIVAFSALALFATLSGSSALLKRYTCTIRNGLANIMRGSVEMVPFAGNLLCFLYDRCGYSVQYYGERIDLESLWIRLQSNLELEKSRSC